MFNLKKNWWLYLRTSPLEVDQKFQAAMFEVLADVLMNVAGLLVCFVGRAATGFAVETMPPKRLQDVCCISEDLPRVHFRRVHKIPGGGGPNIFIVMSLCRFSFRTEQLGSQWIHIH